MNGVLLIAFLIVGGGAGAFGRWVLRRAPSPAPVPAWPVAGVTCALWVAAGWRWLGGGWPSWWLPVPLVLTALAVPLAVVDLRHRRLPDVLTLPAYPLLGTAVVAAALFGPGVGLALRALLAGLVFGCSHLLVHALSRRSLGAGDVKLSGAVGGVLGAVGWPAMFVGAAIAGVITVLLAVWPGWRDGVPHGPGLLGAAWLVSLFPGSGSEVIRWST